MARAKITSADRDLIWLLWHGTCAYCRADLERGEEQPDHVLPLARGGLHELSNIALSCGPCNLRKGKQTADEFGHPDVVDQALKHCYEFVAELRAGAGQGRHATHWITRSPLARSATEAT